MIKMENKIGLLYMALKGIILAFIFSYLFCIIFISPLVIGQIIGHGYGLIMAIINIIVYAVYTFNNVRNLSTRLLFLMLGCGFIAVAFGAHRLDSNKYHDWGDKLWKINQRANH